jgi:hypothetical protein
LAGTLGRVYHFLGRLSRGASKTNGLWVCKIFWGILAMLKRQLSGCFDFVSGIAGHVLAILRLHFCRQGEGGEKFPRNFYTPMGFWAGLFAGTANSTAGYLQGFGITAWEIAFVFRKSG